MAIAITNDGDADELDETIFITQLFAELIPNGPGEARDLGKRGVVTAFPGSPDTPELGAEIAARVEVLKATREGVFLIEEMIPKPEVIQLLSHATVFACPSIYEPLGIVNLEAMACETAVVASATGGIVEVVVDGETGLLVPLEQEPGAIEPSDPAAFAHTFAERVNELIADPERAKAMGRAGRERALTQFDWGRIAEQTADVYRRCVS